MLEVAVKVEKRETLKVYGLSSNQIEQIKDELTLTNPAYISAKRFSKWNVTRIPQYLTFYDVHKDYMELPLGYHLPCEIDTILDLRVVSTVDYPQIKINLRPHQREAYTSWLKDTDNGVICMNTGKGKSILGIYCAYATRQKCLVIVNKNDLVKGWAKDCAVCFGDSLTTGLVKAAKRKVGEQITIATIQTLNNWAKNDLDSFNEFCSQFGMVIVDEMHHIAGSIYDLINHFPAYYRIGLTATPERSDGLGDVMYWYLGNLAYKYEYDTSDEDILPVRVKILTSAASYEPKCYKIPTGKLKDGTERFKYVLEDDINTPDPKWEKVLAEEVPVKQRPKINYSTIDDRVVSSSLTMNVVGDVLYDCYKNGSNTVLFFSQKIHCHHYIEFIHKTYGIPMEEMCVYNGDYSEEELLAMLEGIESEKIKITFTTYSIAKEGTNVKAWDTAFLVSSINNGKNVEQSIGRVRRTRAGKKSYATVFDVRYPQSYALKNHKWERDKRYKMLKCTLCSENPVKSGSGAGRRFRIGY